MTTLHSRSAGIDLLRCLSIVLVLLDHYRLTPGLPWGGTHGVVIFFMVSGYCMAYSTSGRSGGQFLSARFWRLVPALLICATITAAVEAAFPDIHPERGQGLRSYLGSTVCLPLGRIVCDIPHLLWRGTPFEFDWVDGAYWSLLVEIRFYILLWALLYVIKTGRPALILASLGLFAGLNLEPHWISKASDFLLYLPFFAFGMAYRDWTNGRGGLLTAAYCAAVFIFNTSVGAKAISMSPSPANMLSYFSCFAIFVLCMHFYRQGKSKAVSYLGLLTYPLYLIHQDVGLVLFGLVGDGVFGNAVVLATVIAIAAGVNYLTERIVPALRRSASARVQTAS